MRGGRRRSYGWTVVAVSATVNSLAWSVRSTFALFYVALLGEFGWARGPAAIGYSLSWLCLLLFGPLGRWLADRWGARLVVPLGGLVLGGTLSDRWGSGSIFAIGSAIGIGGIGCLAWLGSPDDLPLLLLYAASGLGFGMRIALLAAIPAELFTGHHLGVILGAANGGGGLGGFIGPFLGGWLFDVSGGYTLAFSVASLAIAGSAVAAWIAAPRRARPKRSVAR